MSLDTCSECFNIIGTTPDVGQIKICHYCYVTLARDAADQPWRKATSQDTVNLSAIELQQLRAIRGPLVRPKRK